MNYSTKTIAGGVEILASNDFQAVPIEVATPSGESASSIVKAGTPLTISGEAGASSGRAGILLYDVDTAKNPNGALVVDGIIDATKAQAHSGLTYDSDLYAELPNIIFRTNTGVND